MDIIGHEYVSGVLRYRVTSNGKESWIDSGEVREESLIRKYWQRMGNTRAAELSPGPITRAYIREPLRILSIHEINDETYLLCEFQGFEVPVLVPIRTARNAWTQMVINFVKSQSAVEPEVEGESFERGFLSNGDHFTY
jgi:hypothetical protein